MAAPSSPPRSSTSTPPRAKAARWAASSSPTTTTRQSTPSRAAAMRGTFLLGRVPTISTVGRSPGAGATGTKSSPTGLGTTRTTPGSTRA